MRQRRNISFCGSEDARFLVDVRDYVCQRMLLYVLSRSVPVLPFTLFSLERFEILQFTGYMNTEYI